MKTLKLQWLQAFSLVCEMALNKPLSKLCFLIIILRTNKLYHTWWGSYVWKLTSVTCLCTSHLCLSIDVMCFGEVACGQA
jgi:hypothetical protein